MERITQRSFQTTAINVRSSVTGEKEFVTRLTYYKGLWQKRGLKKHSDKDCADVYGSWKTPMNKAEVTSPCNKFIILDIWDAW